MQINRTSSLLAAVSFLAFCEFTPSNAQQAGVPSYAQGNQASQTAAPEAQIARQQSLPGQGNPAAPASSVGQPFEPLTAPQQAQLNQMLLAWQQQSQGTKTLESKFQRWHFDTLAAPAGLHATRADGVLRYAAPDKGEFRVDSIVFFEGMDEATQKPKYNPQEGVFGEHWVCNGQQLVEFDRSKKECKIQDLPPEMQGQKIFNSPLPFVFNLDAAEIQQRYWVRQVASPKEDTILIEAWPKRQDDRAQYKMVVIALEKQTFLPQALIMYAPNFHPTQAAKWDHYEFVDMKRNSVGQALAQFTQSFIQLKPPADWKILRDRYVPEAQQAAAPDGGQIR